MMLPFELDFEPDCEYKMGAERAGRQTREDDTQGLSWNAGASGASGDTSVHCLPLDHNRPPDAKYLERAARPCHSP